MGIPKLFRWVSERYPLISQLIQENHIPAFDALYLDMNGIIHNCSHSNDKESVHQRIAEEQIFLAIFTYIEHLFAKIKPQKLFFMAVDGVAPRAKMNQQRSRRFRTAKEAKDAVDEALAKGEELPDSPAFDSNTITPGTEFMARLSEQLKYFVNKKVSEDANWQGVEIVLSGHEVPGEGEHKIMEYIRLAKAQPDYDPNRRHCLYGLDADLIMLGLLSHDPHFCLLREEVQFGPVRRRQAAKGKLEATNFYLMHLSLVREYLDHEFSELRLAQPPLEFGYDLERIIDDFILLLIFVGNDFLPHLPGMHINENAINIIFDIYKRILPKAGGYINEYGKLNTKRLQLVLDELQEFEFEMFEQEFADSNWFKGKQSKHIEAMEKARAKAKLSLTPTQRGLFDEIKNFINAYLAGAEESSISFENSYPARDRKFLQDLCDSLHLKIQFNSAESDDDADNAGEILIEIDTDIVERPANNGKSGLEGEMDKLALINGRLAAATGEDNDSGWETVDSNQESAFAVHKRGKSGRKPKVKPNFAQAGGEDEWKVAIDRVFAKYEKAQNLPEPNAENIENEYAQRLKEKMDEWKREYYKEKLEFHYEDQQSMSQLIYKYIEGLQWVLHYYYDGVASWGWFYPYHYAPKISDLRGVDKMSFSYELGRPFKPFEQLMGVLPDLSAQAVPIPYRDLMTNRESPIRDFYPRNFEQDLNGKKNDWEAVVKIPFIDEERLLKAMATVEHMLTEDERKRNSFGESWSFIHSASHDFVYQSPLPSFFPHISHCHCITAPFDLPVLNGLKLVKGLCEGVLLGKDAIAGFPSLYTLSHSASLGFHAVNVFSMDSKNETLVINIDNSYEGVKSEDLARSLVGQRLFVGWPFLREAMVVSVSDNLFKYEISELNGHESVKSMPHHGDQLMQWQRTCDKIESMYSKRYGVMLGHIEVTVQVKMLKGLKLLDDGALVKEYEDRVIDHAVQTTLQHVSQEDDRYVEKAAIPVEEAFPLGSNVFYLGLPVYGVPGRVQSHVKDKMNIQTAYFPSDKGEHLRFSAVVHGRGRDVYQPSYVVSKKLRISALTLSKLTSSLMINHKDQKHNCGLNLKFEAKAQKVLGYTRKTDSGWEFSQKAIDLVQEYKNKFPEILAQFDKSNGSDLTKAENFFPAETCDERMKTLVSWLKETGVRDFERVPLFAEQLEHNTVSELEKLADTLQALKSPEHMKLAMVNGIPRYALLKPDNSKDRLRHQQFALGDRVIAVDNTGNVPLCAKGVVVGLQTEVVDVVFDIPFMGGTTLGDRCSPYRGYSVSPWSILNLTQRQYLVADANPPAPAAPLVPINATRGRGSAAHRGRGSSNNGMRILARPDGTPAVANPNFAGQYSAAATGHREHAYRAPSHQQNLEAVLRNVQNGIAEVRGHNGYHSVAPPPVLTQHHPARGGRGGIRSRGQSHHPFLNQPPIAHAAPPAHPEHTQPTRGRGRGTGRGQSDGRGSRGRGAPRGISAKFNPAA